MTTDPEPVDPSAPLIVVNPRASRLHEAAERRAIVEKVVRAVEARTGRAPRVEEGSLAEAQAALEAARDAPIIVAVGGDGTIRQAAESLVARSGGLLAVVPGGTGNVLAGSLGLGGIGPAIEAIRHGEPRTIDLGEARWGPAGTADAAGRTIFLVACGMGLDARIMEAAEHEWKRRMRFGAYIGAAIRELTRLQVATFRIVADGEALELAGYVALVANTGELVPGRVGPRRPIDPADGFLELLVVGGTNPIAGLHGAARLMLSTADMHDAVIRRSVRTVRLEADPVQPTQTDGDAHPPGWLEATVMPGALSVLARVR